MLWDSAWHGKAVKNKGHIATADLNKKLVSKDNNLIWMI